eukprot:573183-Pelagomonas_calceolata.AAC.1
MFLSIFRETLASQRGVTVVWDFLELYLRNVWALPDLTLNTHAILRFGQIKIRRSFLKSLSAANFDDAECFIDLKKRCFAYSKCAGSLQEGACECEGEVNFEVQGRCRCLAKMYFIFHEYYIKNVKCVQEGDQGQERSQQKLIRLCTYPLLLLTCSLATHI